VSKDPNKTLQQKAMDCVRRGS